MLVPRSVTNRKVVVRTASLPTLAMAKTLHSQHLAQASEANSPVGKPGETPQDSDSPGLASTTVGCLRPNANYEDGSQDQHRRLGQHNEAQRLAVAGEPQYVVCGCFGEIKSGAEDHTVCR